MKCIYVIDVYYSIDITYLLCTYTYLRTTNTHSRKNIKYALHVLGSHKNCHPERRDEEETINEIIFICNILFHIYVPYTYMYTYMYVY